MDREECRERLARRAWALSAMDEEQRRRAGQQVSNANRAIPTKKPSVDESPCPRRDYLDISVSFAVTHTHWCTQSLKTTVVVTPDRLLRNEIFVLPGAFAPHCPCWWGPARVLHFINFSTIEPFVGTAVSWTGMYDHQLWRTLRLLASHRHLCLFC